MDQRSILNVGHNCWRVERAKRAAFLVDGDAYFRAFRAAAARATRSILILAWDFDTRVRLSDPDDDDRLPVTLGDFLDALLARKPELNVYVLAWDFHVIYALEREWRPWGMLGRNGRLHFHRDANHPVGGSHHQKVVVIDGQVAFAGGLDFALCRWDTPAHRAGDLRRVLPDGRPCRPFHDVQMLVEGDAAAALGELVRRRWHRATGTWIPSQHPVPPGSRWPAKVPADLEEVGVGIARTEPRYDGRPAVREVEQLVFDAIAAAKRRLYIETQYLTSEAIGAALIARLKEPDGPEIVIVLHPSSDGWLEQQTMDVLRDRLLRHLRGADPHRRLRLYYPHVPGLGDQCVSIHSKVLVVDDELVRVGSANLSKRSMAFDSECDLAVEARGDAHIRNGIAAFRDRLLAEHLGAEPTRVSDSLAREGSLIAAVEMLRSGERSLRVYDGSCVAAEVDAWVPNGEFIDLDAPLVPDILPDRVLTPEAQKPARRRIAGGITLLLVVLGLAAAWQWTPLREVLDARAIVHYVVGFKDDPSAFLLTLGGFLIGSLAFVPVTVLIAVTVLAFGPWLGFTYAFAGMTAGALLTFGIGAMLGRDIVQRLAGTRMRGISRRIAEHGVLAVVAIRIVPVAPFSIVNMAAGASQIRFRDFLLGTAIGQLPGLLAVAVLVDNVHGTIQDPGPASISATLVLAAALVLAVPKARRWFRQRGVTDGQR